MVRAVLFWLAAAVVVGCATPAASGAAAARERHSAHQRPHHHEHKHHMPTIKKEGGQGMLKDKDLLRDKQHLEEDLSHELSPEQISKMTPEELEYHYFKVHDFDNDELLDGLELLVALSHVVAVDGEYGINTERLPTMEALIDEVLEDADNNKDGFLNYQEYVLTRH